MNSASNQQTVDSLFKANLLDSACSNSPSSSSDSDISNDSFVGQERGSRLNMSLVVDQEAVVNERVLGGDSNETSSSELESKYQLKHLVASTKACEQLINQEQESPTVNRQDSMGQQQSINQDQANQASNQQKDYEEVKQVELFGISIVALTINGKERLCLAQISNTLLKEFSYNEIHNRRVALGITCVQCTPIQLEMLRRAGAMPSSSRRCGMITRREAERLCRSFLVEEQPPELPENFHFNVAHRVNYGCKGRFIPARYISSRAKCIECFFCGDFFSPNKFIFHSHRQPHASDCNPPDSPNINSWRKHIDLDWNVEHSQEIKYAWEDVKSLFNGGTRRRAPNWPSAGQNSNSEANNTQQAGGSLSLSLSSQTNQKSGQTRNGPEQAIGTIKSNSFEDPEQLIDVEHVLTGSEQQNNDKQACKAVRQSGAHQQQKLWSMSSNNRHSRSNSMISNSFNSQQAVKSSPSTQVKRLNASGLSLSNAIQSGSSGNKRHCNNSANIASAEKYQAISKHQASSLIEPARPFQMGSFPNSNVQAPNNSFCDFFASSSPNQTPARVNNQAELQSTSGPTSQSMLIEGQQDKPQAGLLNQMASYPATSFIYNQLYSQLVQQQQSAIAVPKSSPVPFPVAHQRQPSNNNNSIDAQLALRHHLWSSLIANLQCNASDSIYAAAAAAAASQQTGMNPAGGIQCSVNSLNAVNEILPEVALNNPTFQDHQQLIGNLPLKLQRHPQQP